MNLWLPGEKGFGDLGKVIYTLVYLKWITNKDLLYSMCNSTQCYVPAWMGGRLGENWYMYMYGWVPLLFTWNYCNIVNWLFSSVSQSCLTLCNSMNCSMPGLPVHYQLPESTQTHVHQVSDAIQPSHPLLSFLLLPLIPPSIRVFSNESTLHMRWPKNCYTPIQNKKFTFGKKKKKFTMEKPN